MALEDELALLNEAMEKGREVRTAVDLIVRSTSDASQVANQMRERIRMVRGDLPVVQLDRCLDHVLAGEHGFEVVRQELIATSREIGLARVKIREYAKVLRS